MIHGARKKDAAGGLELLYDAAPAAFSRSAPRPLKVGIERDLIRLVRGGIEPHELTAALKAYTGSPAYVQALRSGATRVGVDGAPAGVVTASEAHAAAEELATRMLRADRRRPMARRAAPKPLPPGRMLQSFNELGQYLGRKKRQI